MAIQERSSLVGLALDPNTVTGSKSVRGTVTLDSRTGSNIVLHLTSSDSAVAEVPTSVLVPLLRTGGTFEVTTKPVAQLTSVIVTATLAGVSQKAKLTVEPAVLTSVSVNPVRVEGGQYATGTVTLSGQAPAGGVTVALSGSDQTVATVPASVDVPHGEERNTFSIPTQLVDQDTPVTVAAELAGVIRKTMLTVTSGEGKAAMGKEGPKEKEEIFEISEEPIPHMAGSSTPPESRPPSGQAFISQEERPPVGKGLL